MGFSKTKRLSRRDEVIEQIVAEIKAGNYGPGDRLPSEAALGEAIGVGRSSVREALQGLELLGIIKRTTTGAYVADQYSIKVVSQYLYMGLSQEQFDISHVYEARRVLETELGVEAARRISKEEISELERLHLKMTSLDVKQYPTYIQLNREFHMRICEAGRNLILLRMWQLTDDLLRHVLPETVLSSAEAKKRSDQRHEQLLQALREKDTEKVKLVVAGSLRISESLVGAAVSSTDAMRSRNSNAESNADATDQ